MFGPWPTFSYLYDSGDAFEHAGSILVNISKNEAGRRLLLDPKRGLLKQILMQFDSTSPLRKKGVCIFSTERPVTWNTETLDSWKYYPNVKTLGFLFWTIYLEWLNLA